MLHVRKALCIFFIALFLVQPVFAETEPTAAPDIVTAIHTVTALPTSWDSLSAQTAEAQWLRSLTTAPLYAMQADGTWEPVLARALPEDVTVDYAASCGIPENAQRGYAFRILLDNSACWDDGTPITADDYIFSIQKLLQNEETSKDWTFLANAEAILSNKKQTGSDIISLGDAGFSSVSQAWSAGYTEFYVDTDGFWGLSNGWMSVSDRTRLRDYAMPSGLDEYFVSPAYLYNRYLMDGAETSRYQSEFVGICQTPGTALTMDDLGLMKINDLELVLILSEPAAASTLMQRLEALFLFRQEGSSGYGPYRVTSANGEEIILEPNPNWWGVADTRGYDRIICRMEGKD